MISILFSLNIYLDDHQNTLKYLKNTEINLNNVLIIIKDFDIRNSNWDPSYPHVIYKSTCLEITSPWWNHLRTIQACLPQWLPFLQHISWRYWNPPDILSSTAEILLFNTVFHDGVTPVSVSTLKPPLGAIGVLPLKLQASPILLVCI